MLRPDDTQTMQALRQQVAQNAAVSFAVQLEWSVQPIDLAKVPPLAIFSAYTLYTVEGSREGRRWYGLRLGFFSDAISAKQVAYYVRSEFAAVAVVPVTVKERERATAGAQRKLAPPPSPTVKAADEFKLFDDESGPKAQPAAAPGPQAASAPEAKPEETDDEIIGSRRRRTAPHSAPKTLDETLEILGAGALEIERSHTLINDSGVRHLRVEADKRTKTPFSRLLDRLTDRLRGG
jgi:hypothetical protein